MAVKPQLYAALGAAAEDPFGFRVMHGFGNVGAWDFGFRA